MKPRVLIPLAIVATTGLCLTVALHAAERPENELPMYGGKHNPDVEENKEDSKGIAKLGWQYYYRGDLDTAIKRFNQAWMFDRQNVEAFWGFGVILGRRAEKEDSEHNLKESIRFLEIARKKAPKNARILVDLAQSHTSLGAFYTDSKRPGANDEFNKARALFDVAETLEPEYPLVYADRSILNFYAGDYVRAKEQLDKAKSLGFTPDPKYVADLESKLKAQPVPTTDKP